MMVVLYRVGRNLNRAYRTCAAFGVPELALYECAGALTGPLFSAAGQVQVAAISAWPPDLLALEPGRGSALAAVDWNAVAAIALGGESTTLPRACATQWAHIPTMGRLCLTTEAALAITLYAWRQHGPTGTAVAGR